MTINEALPNLSANGYIERIPGRGSFVRRRHVDKNLSDGSRLTGATRDTRRNDVLTLASRRLGLQSE